MSDNEKHSDRIGKKSERSSLANRKHHKNPKKEYVPYILRIIINASISEKMTITHEDTSRSPVVITEAYVPNTAIAWANVTIKGKTYTFPDDFDYDYIFHSEINEVTGNGFDMIKETLYFKNMPGHPTLTGLAELKNSGCIYFPKVDLSHTENMGNYQLIGTGIFKHVKGSGIAVMGVSTQYIIYHIAWIEGWPL